MPHVGIIVGIYWVAKFGQWRQVARICGQSPILKCLVQLVCYMAFLLGCHRSDPCEKGRERNELAVFRVVNGTCGVVGSSVSHWFSGGWFIAPTTKGRSRWYNLKAGSIENATSCTSDCVPIPTNEDGCECLVIPAIVYSYGLASCDEFVCLFRCHRLVFGYAPCPGAGWGLAGDV